MKLSTRARYGMRAMFELAKAKPDCPVSVKEIAQRQALSAKYLEQIAVALKAAGLVKPVRGMRGGYMLTEHPKSITLGDIYEALEGSTAPVECVDDPVSCELHASCPTRDIWVEMKTAISSILDNTTLQDLVDRNALKLASSQPMYDI